MATLYEELAEYTGAPVELVQMRCEGAGAELAWLWRKQQASDPTEFYYYTDLYIFDLTQYQTMLKEHNTHTWFAQLVSKPISVLDFGGGIGEWSIIAAQNGCDVTYVDVEDSETMKYARWRFKKRGLKIRVLGHHATLSAQRFKLIVAMDVFEHLPEPQPLVERFAQQANYLLCNPGEIKYNFLYPQHISHYELEPHWEHVEHYLWKSTASGRGD